MIQLEWHCDEAYSGFVGGNHRAVALTNHKITIRNVGRWEVACLPCNDEKDAARRWRWLYNMFGINAVTTRRPI